MAVEIHRHRRLSHIFGPDLTTQMPASVKDLPTRNLTRLFIRYSKPIPEEAVQKLARLRTADKIDRGQAFNCAQEWIGVRNDLEDLRFRRFLEGLPVDFYD